MKKINYFNILIIFLSTISLNTFAQTEVTNAPIDKMVDKQEVFAKDKKTPAKDIKKNAKKVEDLEDDLSDFEEIKPILAFT